MCSSSTTHTIIRSHVCTATARYRTSNAYMLLYERLDHKRFRRFAQRTNRSQINNNVSTHSPTSSAVASASSQLSLSNSKHNNNSHDTASSTTTTGPASSVLPHAIGKSAATCSLPLFSFARTVAKSSTPSASCSVADGTAAGVKPAHVLDDPDWRAARYFSSRITPDVLEVWWQTECNPASKRASQPASQRASQAGRPERPLCERWRVFQLCSVLSCVWSFSYCMYICVCVCVDWLGSVSSCVVFISPVDCWLDGWFVLLID